MARRLKLQIIDDAAPHALFRRLRLQIARVGNERIRSTYQTTFWHPLGAPPAAVPEQIIEALAARIPGRFEGVEWWLSRMSTHEVQVDFHVDRDERLALRTGEVVSPDVSTVLFVNRVRGGLLAVSWEPPCEENPSLSPNSAALDLVRPVPNRLAVFDGRMTHGVLDANNQIPNGRLPGPGERRTTLVMNWWRHRPTEVPTFEERGVYRALSMSSRPLRRRRTA